MNLNLRAEHLNKIIKHWCCPVARSLKTQLQTTAAAEIVQPLLPMAVLWAWWWIQLSVLQEKTPWSSADDEPETELKSQRFPVPQRHFNGWKCPPWPVSLPSQTQLNDHGCHGSCARPQVWEIKSMHFFCLFALLLERQESKNNGEKNGGSSNFPGLITDNRSNRNIKVTNSVRV